MGFVHFQAAAVKARTIKGRNSALGTSVVHFNKAEATSTARFPVRHQVNGINSSVCRKEIMNLIFRR